MKMVIRTGQSFWFHLNQINLVLHIINSSRYLSKVRAVMVQEQGLLDTERAGLRFRAI